MKRNTIDFHKGCHLDPIAIGADTIDRNIKTIAIARRNDEACLQRAGNLTTIAITHSFKIASSAEKAFSQL